MGLTKIDKKQMTDEELNKRSDYHPPTPEQLPLYEATRAKFKEFRIWINEHIPEGREKAMAFSGLDEAQWAANAAIARRS